MSKVEFDEDVIAFGEGYKEGTQVTTQSLKDAINKAHTDGDHISYKYLKSLLLRSGIDIGSMDN